jgi:hypothetical protein
VLASQKLASNALNCKAHSKEHASHHRAIEKFFDVEVSDQTKRGKGAQASAEDLWTASCEDELDVIVLRQS